MSEQENKDAPQTEVPVKKAAPVRQRNPNDPRRDENILRYDKESIQKITADPNSGTSEFYQLISMFIGIYAFMMKVKWAAWASMFFFITSILNMRLENKFQQIFTGIGIIIVSFVSVYVQPPVPQTPPTKLPE